MTQQFSSWVYIKKKKNSLIQKYALSQYSQKRYL